MKGFLYFLAVIGVIALLYIGIYVTNSLRHSMGNIGYEIFMFIAFIIGLIIYYKDDKRG